MKLSGAPAEQAGGLHVVTHDLRSGGARGPGVVLGQLVLGEAPGVALVRHVGGQDRERARLPAQRTVLETAGYRRDLAERGALGEEPSDLQLGVDARLHPAEDLEDKALPEDHRRVGLLDPRGGHVQVVAQAVEGPELTRLRSQEQALLALELSPAGDDLEQQLAEARISQGIVDQAQPVRTLDPGQERFRAAGLERTILVGAVGQR